MNELGSNSEGGRLAAFFCFVAFYDSTHTRVSYNVTTPASLPLAWP
jgi:hypothetical protein